MNDSRIAQRAQSRLAGLSEVQLESCLGVPDRHASSGDTDILTYAATSASSSSFSLPLVGGPSFANGGNCTATYTVTSGRVTRIVYNGEKTATAAPHAFCAPIVRTCLKTLVQGPCP